MELKTYEFTGATPVKVLDVVGISEHRCNNVIIQSGESNVANVYFGDSGNQDAYIVPLGNATLDITNLDHLWVKGTSGDTVIIIIER